MTKYVVNSGGISNSEDGGRAFFVEIVKDLGATPKLLFCFFARPREVWEEKFAAYTEGFNSKMPNGIKPEFKLALPTTFNEQMQWADAIYIHGGDDHLVQYWFKQFDIPKIWGNKVVVTNSAGSDLLAKYFWTCDWRQCGKGLGILPIKIIPHYMSDFGATDPRGPIDWTKAMSELKEYGDKNLPIYALKEGAYEIFEQ